jgi:hypothetical protein
MFFVMIDHEQTAGSAETLAEARIVGQKLCDEEPVPGGFSIYEDDRFVENIGRSDGRTLSEQIRDFARPRTEIERGAA